MGQSRPLFRLFSSFSHSNINYNFNKTKLKKKHRRCAWDSNLRSQYGRYRWNHGAMAATHCKCSLGSGSGSVGRAEVRGLNPVIGKVLYSRTYCQLLKRLKIKGKSGRDGQIWRKLCSQLESYCSQGTYHRRSKLTLKLFQKMKWLPT